MFIRHALVETNRLFAAQHCHEGPALLAKRSKRFQNTAAADLQHSSRDARADAKELLTRGADALQRHKTKEP